MDADPTGSGWEESAEAWITEIGEEGDYGRKFVLDGPMIGRIRGRGFTRALDVGCGEGRFCRMMQAEGIQTVGVDPTEALIRRARKRDPEGEYLLDRAETLQVPGGTFDLVVSYLSLIDIPNLTTATARMVDALQPGGTLLVANLTSFSTAGLRWGWSKDGDSQFRIDHYLEERANWVSWRGIRIQNWHRPLSQYMQLFLSHGLTLRHFDEPTPTGGDPAKGERYRRVPWFHLMEWRKPTS